MHFGFTLDSSDIDLLDAHLDLLHKDIPSKHFVLSGRQLEEVFKTCLHHNNFPSSKASSSRFHVLKVPSKLLGRRKIVTLRKC